MSLRKFLRPLGLAYRDVMDREFRRQLQAITECRQELSCLSNEDLKSIAHDARGRAEVVEIFALTAVIAERVLGLVMFDVQIRGALAMQRGRIAEMQTGEGKTLAAVPAVVWYACKSSSTHVLTANDYLAYRDAMWMRPVYEWFGLSVGYISSSMPAEARRAAYLADITYATANEVGFDYLKDGLARSPDELVQRPFVTALIDEADSILIDEARIPLVIAGGAVEDRQLALKADSVAQEFRFGSHYRLDEFGRNVQFTDAGIQSVEKAFRCVNLYEERNLHLLAAIHDATHAHALLKRDVDYVVKNGTVELVDEFKGRIAENRRWPAGLQSAIEAKERVKLKAQGRILGSIAAQNLIGLYEQICGMTGTAATQAEELWKIYKLHVSVIPTYRPVIRQDIPDLIFADKEARFRALVEEIRTVHATGRPILVGTASVQESEALSKRLRMLDVQHTVLNARNDEAEAEIIAQAGALDAVTISTNMAGRGNDIILGGNPPREREAVLELGGLYVIGTTRHEAARIDNQLRGRAGRQGDPGSSRFFVSLEDDLLVRFGVAENPDINSIQRTAESQNLQIREFLWRYECLTENHRREMYAFRRKVLSPDWSILSVLSQQRYAELAESLDRGMLEREGRVIVLAIFDDLWADYLASVSDLKSGIHWISWGGGDPLYKFLSGVEAIYADFHRSLDHDIEEAFATAEVTNGRIHFRNTERFDRGATWTYIATDQLFGTLSERIRRGLRRKVSGGSGTS